MIPVTKPGVYNHNKNSRDPGHSAVEVDDLFSNKLIVISYSFLKLTYSPKRQSI